MHARGNTAGSTRRLPAGVTPRPGTRPHGRQRNGDLGVARGVLHSEVSSPQRGQDLRRALSPQAKGILTCKRSRLADHRRKPEVSSRDPYDPPARTIPCSPHLHKARNRHPHGSGHHHRVCLARLLAHRQEQLPTRYLIARMTGQIRVSNRWDTTADPAGIDKSFSARAACPHGNAGFGSTKRGPACSTVGDRRPDHGPGHEPAAGGERAGRGVGRQHQSRLPTEQIAAEAP
jgi:hypothetical protein